MQLLLFPQIVFASAAAFAVFYYVATNIEEIKAKQKVEIDRVMEEQATNVQQVQDKQRRTIEELQRKQQAEVDRIKNMKR